MELLKYFYRAYPSRTILVCIAITVSGAFAGIGISALLPLFEKILATEKSEPGFFDKLFQYLEIEPSIESLMIFVVACIALKSIILTGANIFAGFTVAKIVKDLRIKLLSSMSSAEWRFFINNASGKLASSLMEEANRAGNGYITILNILSTVVQIIVYLTIAFFVSWHIVVLAVLTSIALLLLLNRFIRINKRLGEKVTTYSRSIIAQLTDSTRSIKSLKAMARESHSNALLDSYTKKLKKVNKKLTVSSSLLSMFQEIILTVAVVAGIYFTLQSFSTSIESIMLLTILYIRSMKLFGKAQKLYQSFVFNVGGYEGIIDSINIAQENHEARKGTIQHPINNDIIIKEVSFSYHNKNIFNNASATIFHKKLNTIIGPSGAGKTTLVDLICGLYSPSSGAILIDNISIEELDIRYWRKQIGYVVQENTLLNTTIKENVTLGDKTFTDEQVILALQKAHAYSFVEPLADSINTIVGENGTKLSGGQRQRILIARALVHNPRLLILDEATSALDRETELFLSEVFKELSREITIISISHRPAMMDVSDHIIELRDRKLHNATAHHDSKHAYC